MLIKLSIFLKYKTFKKFIISAATAVIPGTPPFIVIPGAAEESANDNARPATYR